MNPFDPHHPFDPPADYLARYLDRLDEIPLPAYRDGELDDKPVFQRRFHEVGAYNVPGAFRYGDLTGRNHRLVRAAYWAMVDLIDVQVGRILDALEHTGQRDRTLVIFTSDHGEMLGDHGIYLKGPFFYEQAVGVPLIVSLPGTIGGGRASDALIEAADLAPTLPRRRGCRCRPACRAAPGGRSSPASGRSQRSERTSTASTTTPASCSRTRSCART